MRTQYLGLTYEDAAIRPVESSCILPGKGVWSLDNVVAVSSTTTANRIRCASLQSCQPYAGLPYPSTATRHPETSPRTHLHNTIKHHTHLETIVFSTRSHTISQAFRGNLVSLQLHCLLKGCLTSLQLHTESRRTPQLINYSNLSATSQIRKTHDKLLPTKNNSRSR